MDFEWSEEQRALRELAAQVFEDLVTHDRLTALEAASATVFDRALWAALGQAGILGTVVPDEHGGAGLGLLELLPVLEEQGRVCAPVPLVEALVLGAMPVAAFGTGEQQRELLPAVAAGEIILTSALDGVSVSATRDRDGWVLDGVAPFVAYGHEAARIILPAMTEHGRVVVLLDPTAAGAAMEDLIPTNRQPQAALTLQGVRVGTEQVLAGPDTGDEVTTWIQQRGAAAYCAVQAGVCDGAVRMTATYTSNRRQFDRPIAEFQAVAQRAADAFIDSELLALTAQAAIYRLANGLEAAKEVHVAKFWAGDGGMRALHAAQHLHGGIGVDTDYPLHRHFLWAKRIEHTLGTPTRELIRLGAVLADEPV